MSDEPKPPAVTPVILVKRGTMSDAGRAALRLAGHTVVQVTDVATVQTFYPESFLRASEKAKALAFDYALHTHTDNMMNKSDLAHWYIHFLKQQKAY